MNAAGKLMESDLTVTGAIDEKGGKWLLTLAIVETAGGKALAKAAAETAPGIDKLVAKVKPLVAELYKAHASPPPAEKPAPRQTPDGAKK